MKTKLTLLCVLTAVVGFALLAAPASATWVSTNCADDHYSIDTWKRVDSRAYADVAVREGYEWGGGCWNNNNKDDSPNDLDWDEINNGAEGPDCSGLTFKSWKLVNTAGVNGGRYYSNLENVHGPYGAASFYSLGTPSTYPFHVLVDAQGVPTKNKARLYYMDAYAKTSHIGMIYTLYPTQANTDYIIEAVGVIVPPVGKWERDYADNSDYRAVRREGWSPDCYPKCPTGLSAASSSANVVVVP